MELIEQWLEDYWAVHVSDALHLFQIDECIRNMVEFLLFTGDDQLINLRDKALASPVTGLPLLNYEPVRLNQHLLQDKII